MPEKVLVAIFISALFFGCQRGQDLDFRKLEGSRGFLYFGQELFKIPALSVLVSWNNEGTLISFSRDLSKEELETFDKLLKLKAGELVNNRTIFTGKERKKIVPLTKEELVKFSKSFHFFLEGEEKLFCSVENITPIAFDLRIHLPVLKSVHSFGDKMSSKAMNTALIWSEILGVKDITFVLAFDEPLNQFYFKAPLKPVKFLLKLFDQEDKIEEVEGKGYVEKKFTDIDLVFSIKDGFIEVSNKNRTIDNLQTHSGLYLEFDTTRLPPTNGALGREILKNYPELTQAEKNSDAIFETVNKIFSIRKSQIFLSFKETDKSVYFDAENSYCKLS